MPSYSSRSTNLVTARQCVLNECRHDQVVSLSLILGCEHYFRVFLNLENVSNYKKGVAYSKLTCTFCQLITVGVCLCVCVCVCMCIILKMTRILIRFSRSLYLIFISEMRM
jgi:hypothetical protein